MNLTILTNLFLVFGGILPFIPQYIEIAMSRDARGFSTIICFMLILAHTLRIVYWFGHQFNYILLLQSFVTILTMFLMIEICVRVERLRLQAEYLPIVEKRFKDFKLSEFWQWTDLISYIDAAWAMALLTSFFAYAFQENFWAIEGIGFAGLFIEACAVLPQFVKNYKTRSVYGMNFLMILLWTTGDLLKGIFYVWKEQPIPFILCASIQVFVDCLIIFQVATY